MPKHSLTPGTRRQTISRALRMRHYVAGNSVKCFYRLALSKYSFGETRNV